MAYIETHQSLFTHRKTLRLARLLHMDTFAVVGRLMALWCWALDNAPDGVIAAQDSDLLADVLGWDGVPGELCGALVTAGFLDTGQDGYAIHDWQDYGGKLSDRRERNKLAMRAARAKENATPPTTQDGACTTRVQHVAPRVDLEKSREEKSREEREITNVISLSDASGASDVNSAVPPTEDAPAADVAPPRPPLKAVKPQRGAPKPLIPDTADAMHLARYLRTQILATLPRARVPADTSAGLQAWALAFDLMGRRDKRTTDEMRALIDFAHADTFWRGVILSPDNLRQHWNKLAIKAQQPHANSHSPDANGKAVNSGHYARAAPIEPPPPVPAAFYDPWKDPVMDPALMGLPKQPKKDAST